MSAAPRALLGALAFLTRVPVGSSERAWTAFCTNPWTMVVVAVPLGVALTLPVLLPLPAVTAALALPVWLYLVTGITHLDGLADLGDAAVVHGDVDRRQSVLTDTTTGVGAIAMVAVAVAGLSLAGAGLAASSVLAAVVLLVAAEVTAKLSVLLAVVVGTPAHDGLGAAISDTAGTGSLAVGLVLGVSVALAGGVPALFGLAAGVAAATVVLWWARRRLGGTSGDVFGAINELARLAALHAGLVALSMGADPTPVWTLAGVGG